MSITNNCKPETPLQKSYYAFWDGFNAYTKMELEFCKEFKTHPYSTIRSYQDYHIGEPYHIVAGINFQRKEIRVGAYFSNLDSYQFWSQYGKIWLESYLDSRLVWKKFETKGSAFLNKTADFDQQHGWNNAYKVMAETMLKMKRAFLEDVKL